MNSARYILLAALMLVGVMARGQSDFNPVNPPEPGAIYKLTVAADPADGGTVTGGGLYKEGTRVTVKATIADVEWQFLNWTNSAGDVVSTSANYTYTMQACHETLTAHFQRVPTSLLTRQSNPASLFTATTTAYKVGEKVSMSCNTYSYYTFLNWTDRYGNELSTSRSFTYTVTEDDQVLTANYRFTPSNPSEPSETKPKHKVFFTITPSGSGSVSQTSGMQVSEGSTFSVTASPSTSYVFVNWTDKDGNVVSDESAIRMTMQQQDIYLTANFRFQPGNPSEPNAGNKSRHTLYMPTVQAYKGELTLLPIYLENTADVRSLTFTLSLPDGVQAQCDALLTTSRTSGYTPTASQSGTELTVNIAGGTQISDRNGVVLQIPMTVDPGCEDGQYAVPFIDGVADMLDGSRTILTTRQGTLDVLTPEDGDLQAQFSVDRYMNRAQFTNMTVGAARTYMWDFGDGTSSRDANPLHIYQNPGTYTVRLTAKAIVKESTAEQIIVVNAPSTWTASGDYTLDSEASGVRNFTSVSEMVSLLGQCTIDGDISVAVNDHSYGLYYYFDEEETLDLLATLTGKLTSANRKMTLTSDDGATIYIQANSDIYYLASLVEWLQCVETQGVTIRINDVSLNTAALRMPTEQTIGSGETTAVVPFTSVWNREEVLTHEPFTVTWTVTANNDCTISGYETEGSGDLPAMTLLAGSTESQTLSYEVWYYLNGMPMYTYIYNIHVRPMVNADDYQALRVLYNTLGGASWKKRWAIDSRNLTATAWPGVTFDGDGRVTAIALSDNNLSGEVPEQGFVLPRLTSLNLSRNNLSGNLAHLVDSLYALQTLNMSYCMFDDLAFALPSGITDLNLTYQRNSVPLSDFPLQEWTISDNMVEVELGNLISYEHNVGWNARPKLRIVNPSTNSTVATMTADATTGNYKITFNGDYKQQSGLEFLVQPTEGPAAYCKLRASLTWQSGDANGDGGVDVLDAQQTLNYVLGRHSGNFNYVAANTYEDDIINIQDIVCTVNLFLEAETNNASAAPLRRSKELSSAQVHVFAADGLWLSSDEAVAALDVTLLGVTASQVRLALNQQRYQMVARDVQGGVRIVILSPSGDTLPTGTVRLLRMSGDGEPVSAEAADVDAQRLAVSIGTADGIAGPVDEAGNDRGDIFDLSGRRVANRAKGIYIMNGKKVVKK